MRSKFLAILGKQTLAFYPVLLLYVLIHVKLWAALALSLALTRQTVISRVLVTVGTDNRTTGVAKYGCFWLATSPTKQHKL